jgi:hypothetical protein
MNSWRKRRAAFMTKSRSRLVPRVTRTLVERCRPVLLVRRLLAAEERHNVVQFFVGQSSLPPELKEGFESSFEDEDLSRDMFVNAPGALVIPVAIYR